MAAVTVYICDQCQVQSQKPTNWLSITKAPTKSSGILPAVLMRDNPDPWFCSWACIAAYTGVLSTEMDKLARR